MYKVEITAAAGSAKSITQFNSIQFRMNVFSHDIFKEFTTSAEMENHGRMIHDVNAVELSFLLTLTLKK